MFATPGDFKMYWGIDLATKLKNGNEGNRANMFMVMIEDRIMSFVDATTFRNFAWQDIKNRPWQLELMQKAILHQAMYVFENSDIAMDSGYDPDRGIVATRNDLKGIAICEPCLDFLKQAGIFTRVMKNSLRYNAFD